MPPVYTELPPDVLEAALAPFQEHGGDELAKERRLEDAFMRQQQCPTCGASDSVPIFLSPQHAFGHGNLLARRALRCGPCGAEFDPHSKILIRQGNLALAVECIKAGQLPGFGELVPEDLDQIVERVKRNDPG